MMMQSKSVGKSAFKDLASLYRNALIFRYSHHCINQKQTFLVDKQNYRHRCWLYATCHSLPVSCIVKHVLMELHDFTCVCVEHRVKRSPVLVDKQADGEIPC